MLKDSSLKNENAIIYSKPVCINFFMLNRKDQILKTVFIHTIAGSHRLQ